MTSQFRVNNDFYGSYVEAASIVGANIVIEKPFIQVRKTALQSLAFNAYTYITNSNLTLVNEQGNISSNYADNNGSPLSVTINETGYYFLQANVWLSTSTNLDALRYIVRINYGVNTSSASGIGEEPIPITNNFVGNMTQTIVKLNAGTQITFDIFIITDSGDPAILTYNTSDNGIFRSTFTVARLS